MRNILLNLPLVIFLILFFACDSADKNAESKEGKTTNQALNDELQEDHYTLIKEQKEWVEEKDFFQRRLDTLKRIYDKLKNPHENGYDELIEKIDKVMLEHFDLITQHSKETEAHTELLAKHQRNEIDDQQVQNLQRTFYEKHRSMDKKHDEITEKYKDLIKKVEDFITKAGGKLPDLNSLKETKSGNAQMSEESTKKDTTKK